MDDMNERLKHIYGKSNLVLVRPMSGNVAALRRPFRVLMPFGHWNKRCVRGHDHRDPVQVYEIGQRTAISEMVGGWRRVRPSARTQAQVKQFVQVLPTG